jgi:hypothetical protein
MATDGKFQALCDGLRDPLQRHAATLAESQDEASVMTGAAVVQTYELGCTNGH